MDLISETVAAIRPLDEDAMAQANAHQDRLTKPKGALGALEELSVRLSGLAGACPPPIPEPVAVAVFAGDHGVHAQGVTPWPQEVTAQMVANFLAGGAVVNAFAGQVGATVNVIDVGVATDLPLPGAPAGRDAGSDADRDAALRRRKIAYGTADMTQAPAMTVEQARNAIGVGIEVAGELVDAGNRCLITGDMGIANTTASAALIAAFTRRDPAEVTGRGTGIDDATYEHKTDVVRAALARHAAIIAREPTREILNDHAGGQDGAEGAGGDHATAPGWGIEVLAAVGGLEHAALAGFILGAAARGVPVILDGVTAGAAALVAYALAPDALGACVAGHRSAEPGHTATLAHLGMSPLVDLGLRLGEGTGALLALPLLQSAVRVLHEVATFDSAGVTEKGEGGPA
jgi:nicotinate-nucleotide--dimethylbenzimidazole phosphoribosyltransferase